MAKRIDVIVVAYKNIDYFLKENFHEISRSNINLIIVNNNEKKIDPDNYREVKCINMECNKGYGTAVNKAMYDSDSDFTIITNDDIIFSNGFFDELRIHLDYYKRENIAVIGFNVISDKINRRGLHKIVYNPILILYHFSFIPLVLSLFVKKSGYIGVLETMHYYKSSKFVKGVSGACFLVNRKDFNCVGGFDEAFFLTHEETELFRRLLKSGKTIYYQNELKVLHNHSFSASEISIKESFKSMHIFLKKYYSGVIVYFIELWVLNWLILKKIILPKGNRNEIKYFLSRK
ncbi:glycosyltransferase [candidate division WOR-3 bacterium]|nr:glycosyltransferase [candidate division WOR-3 bacterium]